MICYSPDDGQPTDATGPIEDSRSSILAELGPVPGADCVSTFAGAKSGAEEATDSEGYPA